MENKSISTLRVLAIVAMSIFSVVSAIALIDVLVNSNNYRFGSEVYSMRYENISNYVSVLIAELFLSLSSLITGLFAKGKPKLVVLQLALASLYAISLAAF
jgi:hypothetical protein